ncbi:MAG: heavy-metal-associated domain-containing protein [Coriobacteriia bacterium]
MKAAVHIQTAGFYCGACPKVVEKAVGSLVGVLDVVAVRSMGLTSILYDTDLVDRESICDRIRTAGFSAEVAKPRPRDDHMEEDDVE